MQPRGILVVTMLAALTPAERRGYEFAARCQAEAEYDEYRHNRNSFGDLTEY